MTLNKQIGLLAAAITALGAAAVQAQTTNAPDTSWKSSAAAGLTLTRGNSSTLLATIAASTEKKWEQNELGLGADAAYGEAKVNGVTSRNTDSMHGGVQYNRLFSDRFYGYAKVDGLHDDIANIAYRVTLSPGAGYYFIKQKGTDLSAEVGPGAVIEKLGGVEQKYWTLRVGEKFHHEISDRARVWESAEYLPQVDQWKNYIINAEVGIEADLTADKRLALRATLDDTYNNEPAAGRQKNDAKLVTSIAYKF